MNFDNQEIKKVETINQEKNLKSNGVTIFLLLAHVI